MHSDALLVKAGSGGATLGVPDSRGVPEALASLTLTTSYNDARALSEAFKAYGERTACMIVEPVACNMGVVPPESGFLETARELCTQSGALLVFDEVITGFRYHYGGYQDLVQIKPDLTTLGKIIGGGLPARLRGRARRHHGNARPHRKRLPGGNTIRKPARCIRWDRHASSPQGAP